MLIYKVFLILLFQLGDTAADYDALIFPKYRYQMFQMSWKSCNQSQKITANDNDNDNGAYQYSINNSHGLCQESDNSLFPKDGSYIYSFIFNRTVNEDDYLIISIDGRNYTISQRVVSFTLGEHITIRHTRNTGCNNTIDFWLETKNAIGLVHFSINNNTNSSTRDQLIQLNQYHQMNQSNNVTLNSSSAFTIENTKISDGVIKFKGYLNIENYPQAPYVDKVIMNNGEKMHCEFIVIGDGQRVNFTCDQFLHMSKAIKLSNLEFVYLSHYNIKLFYPGFPNISLNPSDLYVLSQLNENKSTIQEESQQQNFTSDSDMDLAYNLTVVGNNIEEKEIKFTLQAYGMNECNYNFSLVTVRLKNDTAKDLSHQYQKDFSNITQSEKEEHIQYNGNLCQFTITSTNVTAFTYIDIEADLKMESDSPNLHFNVSNQKLNKITSSDTPNNYSQIIFMIVLTLCCPILSFISCILCCKPKNYYYPWFKSLETNIEMHSTIQSSDQSPVSRMSVPQQQSPELQHFVESGQLNQNQ